jgi:hypothetical protein
VTVVDNASIPSVRDRIRQTYEAVGCTFYQRDNEIPHSEFIEGVLTHTPGRSVALLDPDLVFWRTMEDIEYPGLLNGRLVPSFYDAYTKTKTVERLHTSLIVVPDIQKLRERWQEIVAERVESGCVTPIMLKMGGEWYRWDTMAALYGAIKDSCYAFNEELDRYDHLFCGTHYHLIRSIWTTEMLDRCHEAIKNDNLLALKGIYKEQDKFFLANIWR